MKSKEKELRRYWCDGILPLDEHLNTLQKVSATKKIDTKAYIPKGVNGPDFLFDMIIWLGDESIRKYLNSEDLSDCIPDALPEEWIKIDENSRVIEVGLY